MSDQTKRVLIVDDVEFNQRMISKLLSQHGFDVVTTGTGEQAIELCQAASFDAVLMDVNLPGIDGVEATKQIRKMPNETQPGIIGLSAHAGAKDLQKFVAAGMDDCLTKPVDLEQLLNTLTRVVGGQTDNRSLVPSELSKSGRNESGSWQVLNMDNAMKRLGSNRELFGRFIEVFREDIPALMERADAVSQATDLEQLGDVAHRIRGMSANLSAEATSQAAKDLELACESNQKDEAQAFYETLKNELARLEIEFAKFK